MSLLSSFDFPLGNGTLPYTTFIVIHIPHNIEDDPAKRAALRNINTIITKHLRLMCQCEMQYVTSNLGNEHHVCTPFY